MTQNTPNQSQSSWAKLEGLSNHPEGQMQEQQRMKAAFDQQAELFAAVLDTEQGRKLLGYLEAGTIQRSAFNIDDDTIEKVALRGAFRAGQNAVVMQMIDTVAYAKKMKRTDREAEED